MHSSFIDNILATDLDDMQLISKFNQGVFFYVLFLFLVNMHELFL